MEPNSKNSCWYLGGALAGGSCSMPCASSRHFPVVLTNFPLVLTSILQLIDQDLTLRKVSFKTLLVFQDSVELSVMRLKTNPQTFQIVDQ